MFTTWSWRPGQTDGQTEGHRSDAPRHGAGVGTDIQRDGWTPATACITEDGTDGWTDGHWTDAVRRGAGVEDPGGVDKQRRGWRCDRAAAAAAGDTGRRTVVRRHVGTVTETVSGGGGAGNVRRVNGLFWTRQQNVK